MQLRDLFDRYIVIDHDQENCRVAREVSPGVVAHCADSSFGLAFTLAGLEEPAFFWLDAHDMEWIDGVGSCPLLAEVAALRAWPYLPGSVVLIDDVRYLGEPGWPSREDLWLALEGEPFTVADDVLRWIPTSESTV